MFIKSIRRSFYRKLPIINFLFYKLFRRGSSINVKQKEGYYSQYGQDRLLAEIIFKGKKGFFIDIGANDGVTLSNTFYLEKFLDWNGVCIEPQPDIFQELKKNRTSSLHECCISKQSGSVNFLKVSGANMLSGIVDELDPKHIERISNEHINDNEDKILSVQCKTFDEVASQKHIDYVNIDTEGAEFSILKSIDFTKFNINCLSIENNYEDYKIAQLMINNGFILFCLIGDDEFYVKPELLPFQPFPSIKKFLEQ